MATEASVQTLGDYWSCFIYQDIILPWEMGLKDADFSDLRSARLRDFEQSLGIDRRAFDSAELCQSYLNEHTAHLPDAYLYFSSEKKAQTGMIFQHFRNAFSHAHFEYDGNWFELYTITSGKKLKMKARLQSDYLAQFVALLRKGAKTKSGDLL